MKVFSVLLVAFLLSIQAQLWFGKGGLSRVVQLESQLATQQTANEAARARNAQIEAELLDLREGLEMVEEKARSELDMVKPDEIYVQVLGSKKRPAVKPENSATTASIASSTTAPGAMPPASPPVNATPRAGAAVAKSKH